MKNSLSLEDVPSTARCVTLRCTAAVERGRIMRAIYKLGAPACRESVSGGSRTSLSLFLPRSPSLPPLTPSPLS